MIQVNVNILCLFVRDLHGYERDAASLSGHVTEADAKVLEPILARCDDAASFFWLPATLARKERMVQAIAERVPYSELKTQLRILLETLEDEIAGRLVIYMPAKGAVNWVAGAQLLGDEVAAKFPDQVADIDEAGKCLATARYTAAVFHLMRIMEAGVQALGTKIGVAFTSDKVWQNILDEVNKALNAMPKTDPNRVMYAELASLLFAVKLAWRNEVMHPKATYTEEEAEAVLGASRTFMQKLAQVV